MPLTDPPDWGSWYCAKGIESKASCVRDILPTPPSPILIFYMETQRNTAKALTYRQIKASEDEARVHSTAMCFALHMANQGSILELHMDLLNHQE